MTLNTNLTANNNKFEATYQNGKYGFTINGAFYEIGGGGMLDFKNTRTIVNDKDTITASSKSKVLYHLQGTQSKPNCSIQVTYDGVTKTISQVAVDGAHDSNSFDIESGTTITLNCYNNYGFITLIPYL